MTRTSQDIHRLLAIMAALRTPRTGCPWDIEQTFATIAPYTLEEAAEVADAIARNDLDDLREELGDLLLQVVFHSRMAEEAGLFAFGDVVEAICDKLIRRHPHVFGDQAGKLTPDEVAGLWGRIKAQEKAARAARRGIPVSDEGGVLAGVPAALPALARALKLQEKAAAVGFDWGAVGPVLAKIEEEAREIASASESGATKIEIEGEVGDLLFAAVNLARHLGVEPENALRATNAKFTRRFAAIEQALAAHGRTPAQSTLDEMDALWEDAKQAERKGSQAGG